MPHPINTPTQRHTIKNEYLHTTVTQEFSHNVLLSERAGYEICVEYNPGFVKIQRRKEERG
jgi:hypothetical protein